MDKILREIEAALERRGISARAASIRAQGAPEMIRDMRRGHVPTVTRLRSLCEVLGLEFYVGPPRWLRVEDGGALPDVPLRALERASQDLAQITVDAGGKPISDDASTAELLRGHHRRRRAGRASPPRARFSRPANAVRVDGQRATRRKQREGTRRSEPGGKTGWTKQALLERGESPRREDSARPVFGPVQAKRTLDAMWSVRGAPVSQARPSRPLPNRDMRSTEGDGEPYWRLAHHP